MSNRRAKSEKERLLGIIESCSRTPENLNHYSPEDYELAEENF
jgi:hypothetical protein